VQCLRCGCYHSPQELCPTSGLNWGLGASINNEPASVEGVFILGKVRMQRCLHKFRFALSYSVWALRYMLKS